MTVITFKDSPALTKLISDHMMDIHQACRIIVKGDLNIYIDRGNNSFEITTEKELSPETILGIGINIGSFIKER